MIHDIRQSPLTQEEKAALRINSASSVRREIAMGLVWGFFFLTGVLFAILYSVWKWLGLVDDPQAYMYWFVALSAMTSGGYILKACWQDIISFSAKKSDPIAQDLKGGFANVFTANVRRAVEIKEYEDEGTGFFLELDDGRVLCVIGQDLYDYAHDAEVDPEEGVGDKRHMFPQTKIAYRYALLSGYRLGISGIGEPLRPYGIVTSTKRFFKKDKSTKKITYTGPTDGTFYDGRMEDVLKKFGYDLEVL
jgi:hypothetical protein